MLLRGVRAGRLRCWKFWARNRGRRVRIRSQPVRRCVTRNWPVEMKVCAFMYTQITRHVFFLIVYVSLFSLAKVDGTGQVIMVSTQTAVDSKCMVPCAGT